MFNWQEIKNKGSQLSRKTIKEIDLRLCFALMYHDQRVYFFITTFIYCFGDSEIQQNIESSITYTVAQLENSSESGSRGAPCSRQSSLESTLSLSPSAYESQLLVTFLRHDAILSCCAFITQKLKHWDLVQVRKSEQLHRTFLGFFSHMIMSLSCPLTLLTQAGQWLRITNPIQFRQFRNFTRFVSSANS